MKLVVGILVFTCVTAITMHLVATKKIDTKLTVILLTFAIVAGFVAANYDVVKRLKFGHEGLEVETAMQEITAVKSTALSEIDAEVKSHKESIRLLISTANETSDKIEQQRRGVSDLVATATALQKKTEEQKQEISKLNKESQAAKQEIVKLNAAASEIALVPGTGGTITYYSHPLPRLSDIWTGTTTQFFSTSPDSSDKAEPPTTLSPLH